MEDNKKIDGVSGHGTKERIERCALKEFLDRGFNGASLRQIVKEAGVTTGAFYKYYPTKEALFAGLAEPVASRLYEMFDRNYEEFVTQTLPQQTRNMSRNSMMLTDQMIDYIYEHHDVMRLILTSSEGTPYSDFTHQMAVREARTTIRFAQMLRESGQTVPQLDEDFVHMVASGLFGGAFEIILHDMDKETAKRRVHLLRRFYTAGWEKILGVEFR